MLQVDGGSSPRGVQLQRELRGGPGITGVVDGARRHLPAVGGVGVVHESLLWGEAVVLPPGGGVQPIPVRHAGGRNEVGRRSLDPVLPSVVQVHSVGRMEDGDLCGGSPR